MANSTTFLTIPAGQRLGTDVCYFEKEIDFSIENLETGDTADVLRLPKGAIPLATLVSTKTANTDDTAEIAIACPTASLTLDAADTLPAADATNVTPLTTSAPLAADDTVRLTSSVADLTDAVIVVGVYYVVSDAHR